MGSDSKSIAVTWAKALAAAAERWIKGPPMVEGDTVYCNSSTDTKAETFAGQLEREMVEIEERRLDKVRAYAASLGPQYSERLENVIAEKRRLER